MVRAVANDSYEGHQDMVRAVANDSYKGLQDSLVRPF
jgi:hypothetical protein